MAGARILTDDSRLSRLDRRLLQLETFLALISGLAVFALMLLAVTSVGGRNFFDRPLPGYVDWIEQAMPLIAFLGVAFVQRAGGHIRMDLVVGALRGRAMLLSELVTTLAILVLMVLLVWGSWSHFLRSFDFAAPMWSRDSTMDISLPIWPAKLVAPLAFAVLCVRLSLQSFCYARALALGNESPAGVPLPASAADLAAMEADLLDAPRR